MRALPMFHCRHARPVAPCRYSRLRAQSERRSRRQRRRAASAGHRARCFATIPGNALDRHERLRSPTRMFACATRATGASSTCRSPTSRACSPSTSVDPGSYIVETGRGEQTTCSPRARCSTSNAGDVLVDRRQAAVPDSDRRGVHRSVGLTSAVGRRRSAAAASAAGVLADAWRRRTRRQPAQVADMTRTVARPSAASRPRPALPSGSSTGRHVRSRRATSTFSIGSRSSTATGASRSRVFVLTTAAMMIQGYTNIQLYQAQAQMLIEDERVDGRAGHQLDGQHVTTRIPSRTTRRSTGF